MLFNNQASVIISIVGALCFIAFCVLDVTDIFPAMDNLAIRIIIIGVYGILLFNVITANYMTDSQKKMPESEEDPADYRQM